MATVGDSQGVFIVATVIGADAKQGRRWLNCRPSEDPEARTIRIGFQPFNPMTAEDVLPPIDQGDVLVFEVDPEARQFKGSTGVEAFVAFQAVSSRKVHESGSGIVVYRKPEVPASAQKPAAVR